jgi:phage-related protein
VIFLQIVKWNFLRYYDVYDDMLHHQESNINMIGKTIIELDCSEADCISIRCFYQHKMDYMYVH